MKSIMKSILIIATMVICTCASPLIQLQQPTPVNPDELVAERPKEKIMSISDSKEIFKYKRETKQPLYPIALNQQHEDKGKTHEIKSGHATDSKNKHLETPAVRNKPLNNTQDKKTNLNTRSRRNVELYPKANESQHIVRDAFKKQLQDVSQKIIESKNNGSEYASAANKDNKDPNQENAENFVTAEVKEKTQKLPITSSSTLKDVSNSMTISKQTSNKGSTIENQKVNKEKGKDTSLPEVFHSSQRLSTISSASHAKQNLSREYPKSNVKHKSHEDVKEKNVGHILLLNPVQDHKTTEEFQKHLPVLLNPKENDTHSNREKRDWPVPLVPKRHHPEKSTEDVDENKQLGNKKHDGESEQQTAKVEEEKPQLLLENMKNTGDPSFRQVSETFISTSPNKESLKASEPQKEIQLDNHRVLQTPHVPQILLRHNHQNVTTVGSHVPPTLSIHQSHFIEKDIQDHFGQSLLEYNQSLHHEHIVTADNQKSHQESPILQTHNHTINLKQEEILPTISNESKKDELKSTDKPLKTNSTELDASESALSPKTSHHIKEDNKSSILNDESSVLDFTTTEGHPIIRKLPVPVSELFSRVHGNSTTNEKQT